MIPFKPQLMVGVSGEDGRWEERVQVKEKIHNLKLLPSPQVA